MVDYYTLLGVPSTASHEELRAAYRGRMRAVHPDQHMTSPVHQQAATQMTALLNEAWSVLGDPGRRAVYDSERKVEAGHAGPATDPAGHILSALSRASGQAWSEARGLFTMDEVEELAVVIAAAAVSYVDSARRRILEGEVGPESSKMVAALCLAAAYRDLRGEDAARVPESVRPLLPKFAQIAQDSLSSSAPLETESHVRRTVTRPEVKPSGPWRFWDRICSFVGGLASACVMVIPLHDPIQWGATKLLGSAPSPDMQLRAAWALGLTFAGALLLYGLSALVQSWCRGPQAEEATAREVLDSVDAIRRAAGRTVSPQVRATS